MRLIVEREEEREISFSGKVSALLKRLNINAEGVLVIRNSEVITEEDSLSDDDTVKILSVISGG